MVGCYKGDAGILMDRRNGHVIELAEEGPPNKKVLVMETQSAPSIPPTIRIKELVKEVESGKRTAMATKLNVKGLDSDHSHNSGRVYVFCNARHDGCIDYPSFCYDY